MATSSRSIGVGLGARLNQFLSAFLTWLDELPVPDSFLPDHLLGEPHRHRATDPPGSGHRLRHGALLRERYMNLGTATADLGPGPARIDVDIVVDRGAPLAQQELAGAIISSRASAARAVVSVLTPPTVVIDGPRARTFVVYPVANPPVSFDCA